MAKYQTIILVVVFLGLLMVELFLPLRKNKKPKFRRILVNLTISALAFIIGAQFIKPVVVKMLDWTSTQGFGVLEWVSLPPFFELVVGFLLLDFSFYLWHRLNHRFSFFWRFHKIHHIDPDMDVTTSFRFHWVEILYSVVFRVVQIGLIGVSFGTFGIYEIVFQLNTMIHHSNIKLPIKLERVLSVFFVTPRMHGIHHSGWQKETDTNYSSVFSLWDRIGQSLVLNVHQSELNIGVDGYDEPSDNGFFHLMIHPIESQKSSDVKQRERTCISPANVMAN